MKWQLITSLALVTALGACERDRASSHPAADTLHNADAIVPATVLFLAGFDEQGGIIERRVPVDSPPGPYVVAGDIYADAQGLAAVLAPGSHIGSSAGRLTIDGRATSIDTRQHGTVAYASVRKLARELRGYANFGSDGRFVTLWSGSQLCEYRREADTRAELYRRAAAESLFAHCGR
jgi:hypothetical protein